MNHIRCRDDAGGRCPVCRGDDASDLIIGSWRVKETDRIAAMATELRKSLGRLGRGADWIAVTPPAVP